MEKIFFYQKLSNKLADGQSIESSLIWVEFKFDYLETWKQFTHISIKCLILIKMLWKYDPVESFLRWELKDPLIPTPATRYKTLAKSQIPSILESLSAQWDDN